MGAIGAFGATGVIELTGVTDIALTEGRAGGIGCADGEGSDCGSDAGTGVGTGIGPGVIVVIGSCSNDTLVGGAFAPAEVTGTDTEGQGEGAFGTEGCLCKVDGGGAEVVVDTMAQTRVMDMIGMVRR